MKRATIIISVCIAGGCAYDFTMGLGLVKLGEKWGIIDTNGDWVEEPKFRCLDPLAGGIQAETFDGNKFWYKKDPEFWKNQSQQEHREAKKCSAFLA